MFVLERRRRKIFQHLIKGDLHVYEHEKNKSNVALCSSCSANTHFSTGESSV